MGSRSEFSVLNTTPLHPASNDRATISALLDTGEDESRKGFLNLTPQKSIDKSTLLATMIPPILCVRYANDWNSGILECWSIGSIGILHYSKLIEFLFYYPVFHDSIFPSFHLRPCDINIFIRPNSLKFKISC